MYPRPSPGHGPSSRPGASSLLSSCPLVPRASAGLAGPPQAAASREPRNADQLRLAWLATSIATLGGTLGGALESGKSVREAAYTYQPDTQIDAVGGPR